MNPGVAAVLGDDDVTHWVFYDPYTLCALLDSPGTRHYATTLCRAVSVALSLGAVVTCITCTAYRENLREVAL